MISCKLSGDDSMFSVASAQRSIPSVDNCTCWVCGRLFPSPSHVRRHMPIHTGDKPYKCDHCGKRFNQKANLKTHSFVHYKQLLKERP